MDNSCILGCFAHGRKGRQDFEAVVGPGTGNFHGCRLLWHQFPPGPGCAHEGRSAGRHIPDCKWLVYL